VTAVTIGRPRSLLAKATSAIASRKRTGKPSRLTAALAVAREHVVTFAALASADFGAFHWGPGVGWIVTGASLLALDFAVRG
jgi:hypothetical protein